jgi:hypothetical protein
MCMCVCVLRGVGGWGVVGVGVSHVPGVVSGRSCLFNLGLGCVFIYVCGLGGMGVIVFVGVEMGKGGFPCT